MNSINKLEIMFGSPNKVLLGTPIKKRKKKKVIKRRG